MLERSYSKAKAVGNHVIWSASNVAPITFFNEGVIANGQEFGILYVAGGPLTLTGFRVEFQCPSVNPNMMLQIQIISADYPGIIVPGGLLTILGEVKFGMQTLPPMILPSSSRWKAVATVINGTNADLPQGVNLTYFVNYSS